MSINISVSGMKANTDKLSTISQNIANSATAGFKTARSEFGSIHNGGQPGGVEVLRTSQNFDQDGNKEYTGRPLDMAISNKGFFIVEDSAGQARYTRDGKFGTDNENFIVNAAGNKLQGYGIDNNGVVQTGNLTDLQIGNASIPAQASTVLNFTSNFKADAPTIPAVPAFDPTDAATFNSSYSSELYDSLGNTHTLTQYMVKNAPNDWTVNYEVDGTPVGNQNVTFDANGELTAPAAPVNLTFAPAGGAAPMNFDVDMAGTTQYSGEFSTSENSTDGYASGDLAGLDVTDDGAIIANYTNGRSLVQGQLALASFANEQGLAQTNNTAWIQTFESGTPVTGTPGSGVLGTVTSGAYEQSNVDTTDQLVGLMAAQRNYSSNVKAMTTKNDMDTNLLQSIR